ncbi:MAG: nucleotidyl transferase AbiEii/AbiGii toxin family protein [Cyanobacteria bacterium P01_G01_bin.39]
MNKAFKQFLDLSKQDRIDVFEATAEGLNTLSIYIEKDFWVCLVLDLLYNELPNDSPRLLFKGGTSLSKVYKLIKRFSEDVDFTVFRDDLGFIEDKDPLSPKISGKQRKRLSIELQEVTSNYICNKLKEDLEKATATILSDFSIVVDEDDSDRSTLLFQYPRLFPIEDTAYVKPRVKLEGGGRSALDPHQDCSIKPFIAELEELNTWDFSVHNIMSIASERTFWDKVMILHGWHCGYRDQTKFLNDRQRVSRHYYDVAMIYKTEVAQNAIQDSQLRENVRNHTQMLFKAAWKKLDEAIPGSMRLIPMDDLKTALESDYQAMQGMMLGEPPTFDEIVKAITELEAQINENNDLIKKDKINQDTI